MQAESNQFGTLEIDEFHLSALDFYAPDKVLAEDFASAVLFYLLVFRRHLGMDRNKIREIVTHAAYSSGGFGITMFSPLEFFPKGRMDEIIDCVFEEVNETRLGLIKLPRQGGMFLLRDGSLYNVVPANYPGAGGLLECQRIIDDLVDRGLIYVTSKTSQRTISMR